MNEFNILNGFIQGGGDRDLWWIWIGPFMITNFGNKISISINPD